MIETVLTILMILGIVLGYLVVFSLCKSASKADRELEYINVSGLDLHSSNRDNK